MDLGDFVGIGVLEEADVKIQDFVETAPELRPEVFFHGRFEGWGILEGPLGGLRGRFTVEAEGRWSEPDKAIAFEETWTFDNGHVDHLSWLILPLGRGRYAGNETRLDGEAEGEQAGCAFHWSYTRDTPQPGGGSAKLHFDDWFWRVSANAMVVRGSASKIGVPFAGAHVTYRKLD